MDQIIVVDEPSQIAVVEDPGIAVIKEPEIFILENDPPTTIVVQSPPSIIAVSVQGMRGPPGAGAFATQLFDGGGTNTFVLAQTGILSIQVALNGLTQSPGIDFDLVGSSVIFVMAPLVGDNIWVQYSF